MTKEGYRYRKAGRIRIGDGILLENGTVLWVARIEADLKDPNRLVFIDGKNDVATMLGAEETIRLSKKRQQV
jgi:hypothetical protein